MAKTLHYDFLTNPRLDNHTTGTSTPDLSITRATSATMVDADGYIREVQAGEARFTGATFRQNLMFASEGLSTASVTRVNLSAVDGSETFTDDGQTISLSTLTDDATAGFHVVGRFNIWEQPTTDYVVSIYAKAGTSNYIALSLVYTPGTQYAIFDLANGTVSTEGAGITSSGIESIGGGVYRCYVYLAAGTSGNDIVAMMVDSDGTTLSYSGSGSTVLAGGFMVEDVSPALRQTPSTYIKTPGSVFVSSLNGTSTKGLLVEEARTQQAIWTEDISNAAWVASNITKGTTPVTAPDGASNSNVRLTASAANGTLLQTLTSASATRVYSVYMKRVTGTGNIDLTLDGGSTWTTQTLTSEWQRFYITQAAVTNPSFGVRIVTSGDAIDFWGSELNSGATFPTSYISNNSATASVTRNADSVTTTTVDWFNADGTGSWYINGKMSNEAGSGGSNDPAIAEISASSAYFIAHRLFNTATTPRLWSAGETNNVFDGSTTTFASGDDIKWASGWAENDVAGYMNGSAEQSESLWDLRATPMTTFLVGKNTVSHYWNGHIAEIAYFNERLANATLEDYSLNGLPTAFPGTVAGDGGHIWPARSNDPRWAQIITDSGITPSGNFIDDVHAALEAMASTTGAMDDLWKKVKAVYSITDTSEPFTY